MPVPGFGINPFKKKLVKFKKDILSEAAKKELIKNIKKRKNKKKNNTKK